MSKSYTLEWETYTNGQVLSRSVTAPSMNAALEMKARMSGDPLCSCGPKEACHLCGGESPFVGLRWTTDDVEQFKEYWQAELTK